jgi:hypothetical protein
MITKSDLQKAKTLPEMEGLLIRFRKEENPKRDRSKQIMDEIKVLRAELRDLDKSVKKSITEEDILIKIGSIYAEDSANAKKGVK